MLYSYTFLLLRKSLSLGCDFAILFFLSSEEAAHGFDSVLEDGSEERELSHGFFLPGIFFIQGNMDSSGMKSSLLSQGKGFYLCSRRQSMGWPVKTLTACLLQFWGNCSFQINTHLREHCAHLHL